MLSLYRCGRQAEALEAYRDGRRRSVADLGLELGPDLRRLEAEILAESPSLAAPPRPPGRADRAVRRAPVLILAAGLALAGAAVLAALAVNSGRRPASGAASLDIAANSVVALGADGRRAAFAVPLPGRPTDVAARGDQLLAVTVDSASLTIVDARTRTITRTVPLAMKKPAAVAAGPDGVWVVDGQRGLLARLDAGYEHVAAQASWRRTARAADPGQSRPEPTGVAVAGNAAWVTDGSATLRRADARGRLTGLAAPYRLDGVTAAGDTVWAFSTSGAAVVRADARRRRITDVIPIVARPGPEAPAPVAIAATPDQVWVLNGNTATVSRIDARQRGVVGTVALGVEHGPRDIDVAAGAAWVANFDGSVTRIPDGGGPVRSMSVGGSLTGVAAAQDHVWLAATALDQQLPGGSG
jgi:DNA-binding beta-propeller fold protein YncE